ncbi:MAG: tyrosine-type recombinase/integrase [Gemmataceae bacterium]
MSKRNAPGDGSVFYSQAKRCWLWRAIVGQKPDGRARYRSGRARTRAEAVRKQQAAEKAGRPADRDRTTVGEYLGRWLADVAVLTCRATTLERYEEVIRLHLVPTVGGIRLARLTTPDVTRAWADLHRAGRSAGLVKKCSEVLASCLEHAAREGLIPAAPTRSAVKPQSDPPPIEVFTDGEVEAVLRAATGHRLSALIVLAVATGMRQGELFALEWADLTADRGRVHVRRTLTDKGGKAVSGPPKSARGVRTLDLPGFARAALRAAPAWPGVPLVFPNADRTGYVQRNNFREEVYKPLLARAGVRYRKFHTVRHTHASRLLAAGVDVAEVARRLGDTVETVTTTYAHWMPSAGRDTAARLEAIYGATFAPLSPRPAGTGRENEPPADSGV